MTSPPKYCVFCGKSVTQVKLVAPEVYEITCECGNPYKTGRGLTGPYINAKWLSTKAR